jgi:uncharacterized protein
MPQRAATIPDAMKLVDAVLSGATHRGSTLHGEAHWKCVTWTGLELAQQIPEGDADVVALFGLFHDSQRLDDGADRDHGRRAAMFVESLHGRLFHLAPEGLERLVRACAAHADGLISDDPTIGACWDADRLNLCRLGVRPDPELLSTEIARRPEVVRAAEALEGQQHDWARIFARLGEPFARVGNP